MSTVVRYGVAVAAVLVATLLRYLLDPLLGDQLPYAVFFLAVVLVARYIGFGPALLVNLLGSAAGSILFVEPRGILGFEAPTHFFGLIIYLAIGLVSAALSRAERRAAEQAEIQAIRAEASAAAAQNHLVRLEREMQERAAAEERARLYAERLEVLNNATRAFAEDASDYPRLLEAVVRSVAERIRDVCLIRLRSEDGIYLEPVAYHDASARSSEMAAQVLDSTPLHSDESLSGHILKTGEPLLVNHAINDLKLPIKLELWALPEQVGWRSLMIVPMRLRGEIIGLMYLARHSRVLPPYTEDDLRLAQDLADRAALAIGHTRLFVAAQTELTERRRVQAALRESNHRTTEILESISDAFYTLDANWRFTYVNRRAEQLWGRRREDLLGKVIWEEFPTLKDSPNYAWSQQAIQTQQPMQWEVQSPVLSRWISVSAYPSPMGLTIYFRDIHERYLAEQQLQEAYRRTSEILESIGDAFYTLDNEWRFTYVNQRAEQIWRKRRATLIGKTIWEAFPEVADTEIESSLRHAMETRQPLEVELISPSRNRWLAASIYPSERGLSVYFRDIHDRRSAEQQLRESYERISEILESISDAFYAVNSNWHFTYINRKAEELWGRGRDDLLGKNIWKEFPESIASEAHGLLMEAMRDQRAVRFETISTVLHHWVEVNAYPSDNGLSVYFRDITDRKAVEQQRAEILHAERKARIAAEEANEMKLRFLATISHELRTPLTSIKGFASTLSAPDVSWDQETQQEFINIISSEADKLTDLVEQLLDLSRLQAGTLRIVHQPVSADEIISTARPQLEFLAVEHKLECEIPSGLPNALADPSRIAQVLVNLVQNATRYSPHGTPIRVTAAPCDLSSDCVIFRVSDWGPGIPADARSQVFEAFQQLDGNSDTAKSKGAGLGLAICKGIIEAHGGRIWIEDNQPQGATFAFTLPAEQSEDSRAVS